MPDAAQLAEAFKTGTVPADIAAQVAPGKDIPASIPSSPITVSQTVVPDGVWAAVRYLVTFGLPFAVAKGWLGQDTVIQITAVLPSVVSMGWGIFAAIRSKREKQIMEPYVPVEVSKRV